eukprot:COSAG02_NODE_1184_length_14008_cov_44.301963_1_plen_678_part_00
MLSRGAGMEAELRTLKLGALSKRALASGATAEELETAQDEDEPKAAVIALILRYEVAPSEALRGELSKLKLGALSRRAVASGVDADALEAAQDADTPKVAVIELIVRAELSPAIPEGVAERPGLGEPEPEPATREVHSAAAEPTSVDVAGALDWTLAPIQPSRTVDFLPALCIFGSMRFPVPLEARMLFAALQAAGVYLKIVDMKAGQDIDKEVYEWIEHCQAFLAFGTMHYGEDTGNSACTYKEVKYAQAKKKNIILLRMIPWEQEFEELQARVLFNQNMLTLEWQQGQAMPPTLVGEILKAIDLPMTGTPGSAAALAHETAAARSAAEAADVSRAQAEAAKAQAQAQLAQAQASAAAAKAQAEAAQVQAQAEEAMALAAAEEEGARRVQEEVRAAEAAARRRKEQQQARQRQEQERATLLFELKTAKPGRVVELLRQAPDDAEVQEKGCGALVNLANGSEERKAAVASAGGIAAVLAAMGAHGGSAGVQEKGCAALWSLANGSEERRAAVASAGGIAAVVAAMGAHGGSAGVQEHGCGALWNLTTGSEDVTAAVASAGGIAAVLAAMGAHGGSAGVQEKGCLVLRNLTAGSEERKAAVASAGGIAAVVAAMGAHGGSAGLQEHGCAALINLTANSPSRTRRIREAGASPILRAAQANFPDGEVLRFATQLLGLLA